MNFNTPATPCKGIVRNQETYTKISDNLQKRYRSGIGSLLYLSNHLWTELSNTVRELSKCMDKANKSRYKALLREIKYVIDTKNDWCQIKPDGNINGPLELRGYSDAYYAGYNNTQKIVTE